METTKFYPAKERKHDFITKVFYTQSGCVEHTTKKTVLKGQIIKGIETTEIKNPRYKTEEEYNKCICKSKSDRFEVITVSKIIYK